MVVGSVDRFASVPGGNMVYAPHMRCTISGVFGTATVLTPEEWSWGFSLSRNVGTELNLLDTDRFEDFRTRIGNYHSDPDVGIAPIARLTRIVLALIGVDGRVVLNEQGGFEQRVLDVPAGLPGGGSGSAPIHPFQVAKVVSLGTNRAGASGKGRWYEPAPIVALDTTGRASEAQATVWRDAAAEFVDDINAITMNSLNLDDASAVAVASSKGFNSIVRSVSVGRVLDTQRRRRSSLEEVHVPAAVALNVP